MSQDFPRLSADDVIAELGRRFREPARDRRVYCVLGTYHELDKFVPSIQELCGRNSFGDTDNRVAFFDINRSLLEHLRSEGVLEKALVLAEALRNKELTRMVEEAWHNWLSSNIKMHRGLVLAGFELFYAYLDSNALALVRQYAINGKHICLVLPGAEMDHLVWAFDETQEYRRQVTGLVSEWTYVLEGDRHDDHI